jgi:hypothetical protein
MKLIFKSILVLSILLLSVSLQISEVEKEKPDGKKLAKENLAKGKVAQEKLAEEDQRKENLSGAEQASLKALAGIMHLFKQSSSEIWPGFDLSKKEFIFYLPDRWVLLLNPSSDVKDFKSYPKDWPDIGSPALFHSGQYKILIGQLAFYFQIGSVRTVAIGMPEEMIISMPDPAVYLFGFIAHEAFHQYQYDSFGEIPWEREEKYPILDVENTALAYLEMKLLEEAISSVYANKKKEVEESAKKFVAVRNHRWKMADPFVRQYERGMEINEGTAQYVQTKSVELFKKTKLNQSDNELLRSLKKDFSNISMPDYLLDNFQKRMTGDSIIPDDMPRNRIYPVGAALGFLMDYFEIDWKAKAQTNPSEFAFAKLFSEHFKLDDKQISVLLNRAKAKYGYEEIVAFTKVLIDSYFDWYRKDLEEFNKQSGHRIEISFAYKSISRSRSSMTKKWLVDKGRISLCKHYKVYTLKNESLHFNLKKAGLYEENEWDEKKKKVVFYADEISSLSLDGSLLELIDVEKHPFKEIEIKGNNFDFHSQGAGSISISKKHVRIRLD